MIRAESAVDRTAFLAERKLGIGGSDVASLFSVGYGCRQRLWRDKRNETPDFPRNETDAMALGRVLEPFFAEKYERSTGRDVVVRDGPAIHPEFPELRANVDRMINDVTDELREVGVLEIKSVGREVFYRIKREGLPEDYILQLQHYMLVTGAEWGSYAIGSRDSGELLYWDVSRDPVLANLILAEGRSFWHEVQSGDKPERLEPDDARCQRCEYRQSCQGAALIHIDTSSKEPLQNDETLRPLLTEYLERKALLEQATELADETKEELKTTLGDRTAVEVGSRRVYFRPQTSQRLDGRALALEYEELRTALRLLAAAGKISSDEVEAFPPAVDFQKSIETRPLRVY